MNTKSKEIVFKDIPVGESALLYIKRYMDEETQSKLIQASSKGYVYLEEAHEYLGVLLKSSSISSDRELKALSYYKVISIIVFLILIVTLYNIFGLHPTILGLAVALIILSLSYFKLAKRSIKTEVLLKSQTLNFINVDIMKNFYEDTLKEVFDKCLS